MGSLGNESEVKLRKADGERDNQLVETQNHNMLPEAGLNEDNCDTEN